MKHVLFIAAIAMTVSGATWAGIVDFTDIEFWAGSGTNQAALVLDFHDGKASESFAWGYEWNGTASGADMFIAVSEADINLSLVYSGTGAAGFFTSTLDYFDGVDSHSAAGGYVDTVYYSLGYYLRGGYAGETAGNPDPIAGGGTGLPASWMTSPTGASLDSFGVSGRILADGAWDAWSFGANDASWNHIAPPGANVAAAAVPEPATITLMAGGFGTMVWFRRKRKYILRG